jgi:hypothetical protein
LEAATAAGHGGPARARRAAHRPALPPLRTHRQHDPGNLPIEAHLTLIRYIFPFWAAGVGVMRLPGKRFDLFKTQIHAAAVWDLVYTRYPRGGLLKDASFTRKASCRFGSILCCKTFTNFPWLGGMELIFQISNCSQNV